MFPFNPPVVSGPSTVLNRGVGTAVGDLAGNILPRRAGLLSEVRPIITAGTHYPDLWLRDAAVNAWNAGSLVVPEIARDGLLSVVERGPEGYYFPHPDYYDGIVWIVAAWHHSLVTGDVNFLRLALDISRDILKRFRDGEFNEATGLYRGGSFFNDGVSAYPSHYARPTSIHGNIRDWCAGKNGEKGGGLPMQCLSTNGLHFMALRSAAHMADQLRTGEGAQWRTWANALRTRFGGTPAPSEEMRRGWGGSCDA
jgi:hypothetical protein